MKIIQLFALLFIMSPIIGTAQIIEDDFEFYDLGDMANQNPTLWSTWSGVPDDGTNLLIVNDLAQSGDQSAFIGPNSEQNCLLSLYNLTDGEFYLFFNIYIPSGGNASFNIQGTTETNVTTGYQGAGAAGAGVFNSDTMYFDGSTGTSHGVFTDSTTGDTAEFPLDAWFGVRIDFDLYNVKYQIKSSYPLGFTIDAAPVSFQEDATLGGLNFTSTNANTSYWIDQLWFTEPAIQDIDDFSALNFKFYPNPVLNVLNIQTNATVDQIAIYDVLGGLVLEEFPNAISPTIKMNSLNDGVYFVKVTIGDASKTVKIMK